MSALRASQLYLVIGWTICSWLGTSSNPSRPGAPGLVGAVGVDDQRRLLLEGVEHLPDGVGHADDRGLHDDGGLARRLDVAGRHRGAGSFMRREDVFELRPVDERFVELRILAGGIAEHIFDAAGDELIGEGGAAGALERLHAGDDRRGGSARRRRGRGCRRRRRRVGLRTGALRVADRCHRGQDRLSGGCRQAGLGQAADEPTPRYRMRQVLRDQLSHRSLPQLSASLDARRIISSGWQAWRSARNRCRGSRPSA